jgi:hypothetical protein
METWGTARPTLSKLGWYKNMGMPRGDGTDGDGSGDGKWGWQWSANTIDSED